LKRELKCIIDNDKEKIKSVLIFLGKRDFGCMGFLAAAIPSPAPLNRAVHKNYSMAFNRLF
jgi:hypothetical protein